jgi:hypothetical protein
MKTILAVLAFVLVLVGEAQAVTCVDPLNRIPIGCTPRAGGGSLTGGGGNDAALAAISKPFQDLANFIGDDADAAIALSTTIPEIQDGNGQQCWMAMKVAGSVFKAHPVPATLRVISDFEALRLVAMAANKLCADVHCTVVFADAGAMAQAASPVPLVIPSLHDLCGKIPQIAVVAPVSVPPPPVTPAVTPVPPVVPTPPATPANP